MGLAELHDLDITFTTPCALPGQIATAGASQGHSLFAKTAVFAVASWAKTYSSTSEPQHTRGWKMFWSSFCQTAMLMIPPLGISHNSIAQKFPTTGNWNAIWKHLRARTYLNNPNKSNTRGEFGLFQMPAKIFIAKNVKCDTFSILLKERSKKRSMNNQQIFHPIKGYKHITKINIAVKLKHIS